MGKRVLDKGIGVIRVKELESVTTNLIGNMGVK